MILDLGSHALVENESHALARGMARGGGGGLRVRADYKLACGAGNVRACGW
jgi:hypothetical protein